MKLDSRICFSLILLISLVLLSGCFNDLGKNSEVENSDRKLINVTYDFSDPNSGWSTSTYDDADYYYGNGKYEIKIDIVDKIFLAYAPVEKLNSQYTVKVELDHLIMEGHSGLVFNHIEDGSLDDYYVFRVKPYAGDYRISRYNEITGDGWTHLTDWKMGFTYLNEPNVLKLIQNDNKVSFYLNGFLIEELTNIATHDQGVEVGVFVSSLNAHTETNSDVLSNPVTGQFDNFEIYGYAD